MDRATFNGLCVQMDKKAAMTAKVTEKFDMVEDLAILYFRVRKINTFPSEEDKTFS